MSTITKRKYLTKISQLEQLSKEQQAELEKVTEKFPFRSNDYYLSLIDWNDPDDPIRKIIIPHIDELDEWGARDPSDEKSYTVMPGLEHKYDSTAVFLVSDICDGICRYCFRKRFFTESHTEHKLDIPAALEYVREHTEVNNVLLTGGDPLVLSTAKLENIISWLREIDHIHIIRIGSKTPVFNPYRIIDDPALLDLLSTYSTPQKKIYVITHFVHPKELTDVAIKGIDLLQRAGAIVANQTPLIKGLNDDPDIMAELLAKLSYIGAAPYYIFQCRPAQGNKAYTVPLEKGYDIVQDAKSRVSGLAKRVRYAMSHSTGKVEIIGKNKERIFFRYHRTPHGHESGRFLSFPRNPNAYWLDDYAQNQ